MDAVAILRSIVEDGFLSETNMQRGRAFLDRIDQANLAPDLKDLLAECRTQYERGDKVNAIKRYRSGAGCSLREAHGAVTQGANFFG